MLKKSSLEAQLDNIRYKRAYSLPLVDQAIEAYSNGVIRHNMLFDSMTTGELGDKLQKIRNCGTIFEIREYGQDRQHKIIHNGNYCKNPLVCPVCADRVSKRRRSTWSPRIRAAVKRYPFVYMLVLTIQDGRDMRKQLKDLSAARRYFRRMGQKRSGSCSNGEARKIGAATVNTEIIYNEKGEIHAHDHLLIFCSDPIDYAIYDPDKKAELKKIYGDNIPESELYKISRSYIEFQGKQIPASKLSREWHKATGGKGINISCIPLSYRNYLKNPLYKGKYIEKYEDWLVLNSVECLKYNSKLSLDLKHKKITADQYVELLQRRGTARLFNTLGAFRKPNDSLYFDEKEIERLEYIEEIKSSDYVIRSAQWQQGGGYKVSDPLSTPLFSDSDPPGENQRCKLKFAGLVMGDYHALRCAAMKFREIPGDDDTGYAGRLESYLDNLRAAMKGRIKEIWKADLSEFSLLRFAVPSCFA